MRRILGSNLPGEFGAGLVFPGASLPNAMVQLSPITKFGSGAGYEYENTVIHAFAHTNKGHWNLCNIPILPVTGEIHPDDFGSPFSHKNESAHPGYYQVFLDRYAVNAELTTTLRCGYHRYTYKGDQNKKLVVNLGISNEKVTDWKIEPEGDYAFQGFQATHEKVFFYAVANQKITRIERLKSTGPDVSAVDFADSDEPVLEIKLGLSFVSSQNAKENLEKELTGKSFEQVEAEASKTWETLLSKIQVSGGTERQKGLFYSCLYRSFLWPRSAERCQRGLS